MNPAALSVCIENRAYDLLDVGSARELVALAMSTVSGSESFADFRVERCWPVGAPAPTGFVVEWSFSARGRRYSVYGECGATRKKRGSHMDASPCGSHPKLTADGVRDLAWHIDGVDLVLRSPDRDALLPQLSDCLDRKHMSSRLAAFGLRSGANGSAHSNLSCRLGGYRPGRRATVRFGMGPATRREVNLCGKTFRDDRGKKIIEHHLAISGQLRRACGSRIRVPSPVGFDEELKMALFVWMPGRRAEAFATAHENVLCAASEALSVIHELPPQNRVAFTAMDEYSVIDRWRRVIAHLSPVVADDADALAANLASVAARVKLREAATIHRDFYEKQIILSPQCITVLDLDTLAQGDVCVDVGNFVSHMLLGMLASNHPIAEFAPLADQFVADYENRRGPLDRFNLAFYASSALFRLGAVHAFRTATSRFRPTLWSFAGRLLARESFTTQALLDASRGCTKLLEMVNYDE